MDIDAHGKFLSIFFQASEQQSTYFTATCRLFRLRTAVTLARNEQLDSFEKMCFPNRKIKETDCVILVKTDVKLRQTKMSAFFEFLRKQL